MSDTTATLRVPAPAAEVWAVLADFGEIARWAAIVDHSCLLSAQREGVGMVRRIQSGRRTLVERVVEWVDGERLSYVVEGLPSAIRSLRNTWQLDDGDGSTQITLTSSVDVGPRPPQQLAATVLSRQLSKVSNQMLHGLDDHLRKAAR
ncbi:SRPBCC family protein [Candidatus Poriferisodalis sp.]|uniref:SRPBCC family protein n=1 Tax=Candidatus Poriferisodalis sp. TaxID=3101277 RepID=UPI003B5B6682